MFFAYHSAEENYLIINYCLIIDNVIDIYYYAYCTSSYYAQMQPS